MTEAPEEERFSIGLMFGESRVEFYINSRSTRGKRWAFFGLLSMAVLALLFREIYPVLTELNVVSVP